MTTMENNLSIHVLNDALTVQKNSMKHIEGSIDEYKTSLRGCEEKLIKTTGEIAELEKAITLLRS